MSPPEASFVVPRKLTLLQTVLLVLACIVVGSVIESGFDHLKIVQEGPADRFSWRLRSHLLANAMLALCLPIPLLLARRFLLGREGRWRAAVVHAAGGLLFGALHLFLVALEQRLLMDNPQPLIRWTIYLFSWYMARDLLIYFSIVGIWQALWYQRALRAREIEELRLKASLSEARMAALQAQLRPHFLFNVLNTAAMLIRQNANDKAIGVLEDLGALLRGVLRSPSQGDVTIGEELEFARRYLELEQVRFEDRLRVSFECADDVARRRVPFLLLQPLVENAIRHGVARHAGPASVDVRARRSGNGVVLEVQDSGAGSGAPADAGTGIGLRNVRERLRERFGERAALTLEPALRGGTIARIVLPGAA